MTSTALHASRLAMHRRRKLINAVALTLSMTAMIVPALPGVICQASGASMSTSLALLRPQSASNWGSLGRYASSATVRSGSA